MLLYFTDANTQKSVAINPEHIVCIFTTVPTENEPETTIVNMVNGNIAIKDDYLDVVGRLNGELK